MRKSRILRIGLLACLLLALGATQAAADDVQPFQFSDAFYLENGIDRLAVLDHFVFPDAKFPTVCTTAGPLAFPCRTSLETSPDPDVWNDVRVIETTVGFKHNGNWLSYMAPSKFVAETFLDNSAGDETLEICNDFRAFLFPLAAGIPDAPGAPNRRQDNIFETNGGYFSNNPLGCWRLTFVAWDGPNVNSSTCQDEADDLADDNGVDKDGTSLIRELNEVEDLEDDGCVTVIQRPEDGSRGFPWVA